jgi:hypothetical protein
MDQTMKLKVFYEIVHTGSGNYTVKFWTNPDKSNLLTERFVVIDEAKLRKRLENVCGYKHFDLIQVKK